MLNITPCVIQEDLVVYHLIDNSLYLLTPTSPSTPILPLGNHKFVLRLRWHVWSWTCVLETVTLSFPDLRSRSWAPIVADTPDWWWWQITFAQVWRFWPLSGDPCGEKESSGALQSSGPGFESWLWAWGSGGLVPELPMRCVAWAAMKVDEALVKVEPRTQCPWDLSSHFCASAGWEVECWSSRGAFRRFTSSRQ